MPSDSTEPNDQPINPNILIYHLISFNIITLNLDFIVPPNKIYNIHKCTEDNPNKVNSMEEMEVTWMNLHTITTSVSLESEEDQEPT